MIEMTSKKDFEIFLKSTVLGTECPHCGHHPIIEQHSGCGGSLWRDNIGRVYCSKCDYYITTGLYCAKCGKLK